jgi:hypothetical protein
MFNKNVLDSSEPVLKILVAGEAKLATAHRGKPAIYKAKPRGSQALLAIKK